MPYRLTEDNETWLSNRAANVFLNYQDQTWLCQGKRRTNAYAEAYGEYMGVTATLAACGLGFNRTQVQADIFEEYNRVNPEADRPPPLTGGHARSRLYRALAAALRNRWFAPPSLATVVLLEHRADRMLLMYGGRVWQATPLLSKEES